MGKTVFQLSPDGGTTKYDFRDSNIAPIELDSAHASQPYAVNEEFVLDADGNLYTATSPISQGSAIVVYPTSGYNCKLSESVTGQIKDVKDNLGTASTKNSTSVVTQSTDLVESGAVYDAIQELSDSNATAIFTKEGNPIVIDNAVEKNAESLKVDLEPIQSGSGTPSPDNIRSISGRTETSVVTRNEDNTDSHTVTLQFGETVYGGEVDFNTGLVTVNKVLDTTTLSQAIQTWNLGTYTRYRLPNIQYDSENRESAVCNIAFYKTNWTELSAHFYIESDGVRYIFVPTGTPTTTVVEMAYELATPFTIQLTPAQLRLHKGYNYVTADGDITISYHGEIKQWVEDEISDVVATKADNSVIGTVEDGTNPTKSYAVGEHMTRGGKFCTVTSPVTTSSTWTLNGNYVEGTIADNLTNNYRCIKTLVSSDDLNNVKDYGVYAIGSQPSNSPTNYCVLEVLPLSSINGEAVVQKITKTTEIYTRSYTGNPLSWTSWYKFEGTIVS